MSSKPRPIHSRPPLGPGMVARYARSHVRALGDSLRHLYHGGLTSLLMIIVIGLTLMLPASLYLLVGNLQAVSRHWPETTRISLFLKDTMTEDAGRTLTQDLANRGDVEAAHYISRAQALQEFRTHSGFGDAVEALGENPLPAVIVVQPRVDADGASDPDRLITALSQLPTVERVLVDRLWLQRLFAMLDLLRKGTWLLVGLLGTAVIIIIANTLRLDIQAHDEEIRLRKLLGASNAFIRRPFLYLGLWYGLLGAGLTWLLITGSILWLAEPVQHLAALYQSDFRLAEPAPQYLLVLLACALTFGWLGAWFAVGRHWRSARPT